MLEIRKFTKSYGEKKAVEGISLYTALLERMVQVKRRRLKR